MDNKTVVQGILIVSAVLLGYAALYVFYPQATEFSPLLVAIPGVAVIAASLRKAKRAGTLSWEHRVYGRAVAKHFAIASAIFFISPFVLNPIALNYIRNPQMQMFILVNLPVGLILIGGILGAVAYYFYRVGSPPE